MVLDVISSVLRDVSSSSAVWDVINTGNYGSSVGFTAENSVQPLPSLKCRNWIEWLCKPDITLQVATT